jgi:tetratricopeptide (TPR) repeat protein
LRILRCIIPCVLAVCAASAQAKSVSPETIVGKLQRAEAAMHTDRPKDALTALNSIDRVALIARQRAGVEMMRAAAFVMLDRNEEALAAFRWARSAVPGDSEILLAQFESARSLGIIPAAQEALDAVISADPARARTLDSESMWSFLRVVRYKSGTAAADDLTIRLANIGFGGDDFVTRDAIGLRAIDVFLERKAFDDANRIAATITDRVFVSNLLTQRRYSSLWPALETRVGPGMRLPLVQSIASAKNWLGREPQSVAARRALFAAFQNAERLQEADKLASSFATTPDTIKALDESGGWLVNDHAILLQTLGRPADSDARFASLEVLDIEKAPWLISMIINRGEMLVRSGRYAEANKLFGATEARAKQFGSPYAEQLVRRMKACAAHKQKQGDAAALRDDFIAHEKDARMATAEGLICLDRLDDAAKIAVELLADADEAAGVTDSLRPVLSSRDPSSWGAAILLTRPDVRAAVEKSARTMPDQFAVAGPVE